MTDGDADAIDGGVTEWRIYAACRQPEPQQPQQPMRRDDVASVRGVIERLVSISSQRRAAKCNQ